MAISHRHDDQRVCGAKTVVVGQDFVTINDKLWAVKGDTDNHGDGQLKNSQSFVSINDKYVILVGDHADPDDLCFVDGPPHCDPYTVSGDQLVEVD